MYAEPKTGVDPKEAAFYHRLDLPGLGSKGWQWDLRGREAEYLGNFDFAGKRVLEFGAAAGGLTFWIERQGAEVVSVDLSPDPDITPWDIMERPGLDVDDALRAMQKMVAKLNNAWWYGHEHFGSKAKLVHSTAYDVPRDLGTFDVVTFGAILLHLRDPLRALEHGLRFTRDAVIVTDILSPRMTDQDLNRPVAFFAPNPHRRSEHGGMAWWHLSPVLISNYLSLKGFELKSFTKGEFTSAHGPRRLFTVVARRV